MSLERGTKQINDSAIREVLISKLVSEHSHDKNVIVMHELGLAHGENRVDLAVINGSMHGYEIKSDRDTLDRLPEQMLAYDSVFDYVTIVVGKKHLLSVINMVPDWWGILVAKATSDGPVVINTIRLAQLNKNTNPMTTVRLLWREEALDILETLNRAYGVKTKSRSQIYERLVASVNSTELRSYIRNRLIQRSNWRVDPPLQLNGG